MSAFDISTARRLHVIGAGGAGMSPIAGVLTAMGHDVSGSDSRPSSVLESVAALGVDVWVGSQPDRITSDIDAVVVSTAIPDTDGEVKAAREAGVAVLRRAEALAAIAGTRRTVAVAGTHGKTTTSTFLALALEAGGMKPSWIIGGQIAGRGRGHHWDSGAWFVVEADESDATFLQLGAEATLVTNIEPDHLETYGGWEGLRSAFRRFVTEAGGPCVLCADDAEAADLARQVGATTYGIDASADYRIEDVALDRFRSTFSLRHGEETTGTVTLQTAGIHNVTNAAGALATAHCLGVPLAAAAAGIEGYAGVARRFTPRGEAAGVTFVDDYAHLPTEVRAAVSAARGGGWQRVVAVFQPHRYSRTEQVGRDFAGSFDGVGHLFLTGIYSSGEAPRPGINGRLVLDAVEARAGHPPVTYVEERSELAAAVAGQLQPGDLCLTLGAGDITGLSDELIGLLS